MRLRVNGGKDEELRTPFTYHRRGVYRWSIPPPAIEVPPPDNQQHLISSFLRYEKGTDVVFEVGSETIAARSTVFAAELFGPAAAAAAATATSSGAVRIDDMDARVFRLLLGFIYSDSAPEVEAAAEDGERGATWRRLLVAADRYGVQRLRLMCEEKLCGFIDESTVATFLALAEQRHCHGLKEACLAFLNSPAILQQVTASGGFKDLAEACPSVLKELIVKLYG
ncbi:hypothetical protein ACP4OV_004679 [Aristida adscensionis]